MMDKAGANIYRHIDVLMQALSSDKNKVAFFLGAGCPFSIRLPNENGDKQSLIPNIDGLTSDVCEKLADKHIDKIKDRILLADRQSVTIEDILSHVRRIAKEGRKYGVGIMVVSQRPSEIDTTILSQCGTTIAMRLANNADRGHVTGAAADNLKGLFDMLPILRTGEAIVVGEAVSLPIRTIIEPPPSDRRPDSVDPKVVTRDFGEEGCESPGGWNQAVEVERYDVMVHQWRTQSASYNHDLFKKTQENEGHD